jgi:hypothetical protein
MQFKILLIIFATAKLANLNMIAYQKLDKPFTQAYKQILALPLKIQTTAGVGLPQLLDRSQTQK